MRKLQAIRPLLARLASLFFYALVGIFFVSLASMAWSYHRSEWISWSRWGAVIRNEHVAIVGTRWNAGIAKGGLQFSYSSTEALVPPERTEIDRWGMDTEWKHSSYPPSYPTAIYTDTRGTWWINFWWIRSQGWIQWANQRETHYGFTVPLALPTLISGGLALNIWRRRRRGRLQGFPVEPATPLESGPSAVRETPATPTPPPRGP